MDDAVMRLRSGMKPLPTPDGSEPRDITIFHGVILMATETGVWRLIEDDFHVGHLCWEKVEIAQWPV